MIIPNHPREIWSPVCLLSQLLSIPDWEVEEWRAGVLQLLALWIDHKGSLILAEHAFVFLLLDFFSIKLAQLRATEVNAI